jgi:hypothetical protein
MKIENKKYYVRIYRKTDENESWQTLGPYDKEFATRVADLYLSLGLCSWVQDVEI